MTKISTQLAGNTLLDRAAYQTVRTIVTSFCRIWCRMSVEGRENVPADGPSSSRRRTAASSTRPSRRGSPPADAVHGRRQVVEQQAVRRLLTALGGFPVTRGTADREALQRCIAVLEGGEPLVLFPEGERKSGPIVQPLFDGAAYIAMKTGVPIVPVGIGGSERVMPKGAKFIHPRKMYVVVGKPIPVATDAETPKRSVTRRAS